MMTQERFELLLEAYGANPASWPESEREAALKHLEASPHARRLFDEAAALDRLIDRAETLAVSPALQAKLLAALPRPRDRAAYVFAWPSVLGGGRWIHATAFAMSLLLGLAVGAIVPPLAGLDRAQDDPALVALGDIDDGFLFEGGGS